jgi:hypothetical protein
MDDDEYFERPFQEAEPRDVINLLMEIFEDYDYNDPDRIDAPF